MKKFAIACVGLLASLSASATALPAPGSIDGPSLINYGNLPTFDATGTVPYLLTGGGTGNLLQAVKKVNATTFEFFYQVDAVTGGTSPVLTMLLRGFAGYSVEAFFSDDSTPGGLFLDASTANSVKPVEVSRNNAPGNTIRARFDDPPAVPGIVAPQDSKILVLRVNGATGFSGLVPPPTGAVNEAVVNSFAPTPEPSFYVAVSLGLAGLFVARRRKANVAEETAAE